MIRVSVAVQHHPSREHLLEPLMNRLGGFELVVDPDPGGEPCPMRTYRECLLRTPSWATHRLVIQDDAWPCANFGVKAEAAIVERPDTVVCFFTPGIACAGSRRILAALKNREAWAEIGGKMVVPLVATSWPVGLIAPFLAFANKPRYREMCSDDGIAAAFVKDRKLDVWRDHKREVWATVPCIVQHPDVEPSLIGAAAKAGRNRARVASFIAE